MIARRSRWTRARVWRRRSVRALWPGTLGAKLVLILTVIGLLGAVALVAVLASVIVPSFDALERRAVAAEVDRLHAALDTIARSVEQNARDYVDGSAGTPIAAGASRALKVKTVDGIAQVAPLDGVEALRWRKSAGVRGERGFATVLTHLPLERIAAGQHPAHFYTRLGGGIVAIGVARVYPAPGGTDGSRRYVVMARRLSAKMLSDAAQQPARIDLTQTPSTTVVRSSPASLRIAVPIAAVDGRVLGSVTVTVRRDLAVLGQRVLLLAVAGSIILLLIVLLVLSRMMTTLVLRPLARVERHMQTVPQTGSLALLRDVPRNDEIGSLAASFNAMLCQLQDLRGQLELQNFALGRSDSATAILHNVRNALTPVSTIVSRDLQQPPPVDRDMIDRAIAELAQDDLEPARRAKLAAFTGAAVAAVAKDRAERQAALLVAREAMAQVLEIIGQQHQAAQERPELSPCDVKDIVARNATIARYSGTVSIAFSFPAQRCDVIASRILLSQVIGNLFANAADAIAARGTGSGSIGVTIERVGDTAWIAIRDDGEGIERGAASSLFQRGYSTRAHKVGGLGLHWCANAMRAMQGTLRLDSAGPGQGAVATLTLPLAPTGAAGT